jgi:FkbH-like protein
MSSQFRCVTLSDFNLDNFNSLLTNDNAQPPVEVIGTDYGQVRQYLLDPDAACWHEQPDCAVVWTRPEAVVPTFGRLKNFESVDLGDILDEVDEFANQLIALEDRVDTVLVPSWTMPLKERGLGLLDMQNGLGIANTLMRMNLRLSEALADRTGFFVLNAAPWIQRGGDAAYNPKLWAMAKIPFASKVFEAAVGDVKGALRAVRGDAKKLIILDLDDTLWGGVVGEVGWENLQLGGHDAVGEAYAAFQRALKAMTNRGILLGIVSKNTEEVALEAFEKHPEMVLSLDDFAGWRINWDDKAKNVAALIEDVNLGRQSAVFVDNNSFERGRVREALPEVFVPEWPDDPFRYRQTLLSMRCFDTATLTEEDRERASMYVAQRKRSSSKGEVDSLDEWLDTLDMTVEVEPFTDANRARVVQLLNKTNQMNLRTRRMSEAEFVDWLDDEDRCFRAFRVSDRFGNSGLTGIFSIEKNGESAHFEDFILSCRVMGRQVEDAMLAVATEEARRMGARDLVAEYRPTEKNAPCLEFWQESAFETGRSEHVFQWALEDSHPVPSHIDLVRSGEFFYNVD